MRQFGKQLVLAILLYVGITFVFNILFVFANGSGLEASGQDALPYYVAGCAVFGFVMQRWWVLPFPVVHEYVIGSAITAIRYDGPISYDYSRVSFVVLGTLGIAGGFLLHLLYDLLLRGAREAASNDG